MQNIHRSDNSRVFCCRYVHKHIEIDFTTKVYINFVSHEMSCKFLEISLVLRRNLSAFTTLQNICHWRLFFFNFWIILSIKNIFPSTRKPCDWNTEKKFHKLQHSKNIFLWSLRNSNWRHSSFFPERILSARIYNRHMALCRAFTNFLCCLRFGRWIFFACLLGFVCNSIEFYF